MSEQNKTGKVYSIKLVRADRLNKELFSGIDKEAEEIIKNAPQSSILALTLTTNTPSVRIVKAEVFNEKVFENILGS